jgi:hypothetical protein
VDTAPLITTESGVSVIPVTCARCELPIPAGEKHLRHTDRRGGAAVRFPECVRCARRAGRAGALDR